MTIKNDPIPERTNRSTDVESSEGSSTTAEPSHHQQSDPAERQPLLSVSSSSNHSNFNPNSANDNHDFDYSQRYDSVAAPPSYNSISQGVENETMTTQLTERERKRRKKEKYLFAAFLLFIFSFVAVFFLTISKKEQGIFLDPPFPVLSDGDVIAHASWTEPRIVPGGKYYRTANFNLPIRVPLFFHTSGNSHTTDLIIQVGNLPSNSIKDDEISIIVEVSYTDPVLFDTIGLFQLQQIHGSGEGLGLYQDEGNHFKEGQTLDLVVYINIPRKVENSLEPQYLHSFRASSTGSLLLDHSLIDQVQFGSFSAKLGKDISIRSLRANESLELQSTSGTIRSTLDLLSPRIQASAVSIFLEELEANWITLDSTDGQIAITRMTGEDVRMRSLSAGPITTTQCTISSSLEMESASGPIIAQIILNNSTSISESHGTSNKLKEIKVQVATGLGSVDLNYLEHPRDVILTSRAGSVFGRIVVNHPNEFIGDFSLKTLLGNAIVISEDESRIRMKEAGKIGKDGSFVRGEVLESLENRDEFTKSKKSFSSGYTESGRAKLTFEN